MTRSSRIPPSSRQSSVYWERPGATCVTSFVSTPWRNSAAPLPRTSRRPMWLAPHPPAPFGTARFPSRIGESCWGSSQPPKSTIRPPSATCSAYSAVRSVAAKLALAQQVGDLFGLDVEQQLLVVAAAGIHDDRADVLGSLRCPLQPLADLSHGRGSVQLTREHELDPVVVSGRLDEQPFLAHRLLLGQEGVLHGEGALGLGEALEGGPASSREGTDRRQQADRSILEEVPDREASPPLGVGELEHHAKPCLEQARDRAFVGPTLDP